MLLNGTPFAFVIDLAALASRREYLKLDKWLTDKIREHGVSSKQELLILKNLVAKMSKDTFKKKTKTTKDVEPRTWHMLGHCFTSEPHPCPKKPLFKMTYKILFNCRLL